MSVKDCIGVILDTETSGKGPGSKVIESARMVLAATPLEFSRIKPEDSYMDSKLYGLPDGAHIDLGAMVAHGIADEDIAGLAPFQGFDYHGKFVVGHHVDFDVDVTGYHGASRICTLALSRWLWPHLDSHTQGAVLIHIGLLFKKGAKWGIELNKGAHRAAHDVLNCSRILKAMIHIMAKTESMKHHVESWEALAALSLECMIPKVMAFSKHKDRPIEEVPQDWIDWLYSQPGPHDKYLASAFRRAGKSVPENV